MAGSKTFLAGVISVALAGVALAGCTFAPVSNPQSSSSNADQQSIHGWVGTAQGAALFVQWTRNGDKVSGNLIDTEIDSSNSSNTKNYNESFTGSVSGNSVTLTFNGAFGSSSNLSGTLQDSKLILSFPQRNGSIQTITMTDGTIDEYNKDVSNLTSQAQSNGQASAKASADAAYQQRVARERQAAADDMASLDQDSYFKNLLTVMSTDLVQTSKDLQLTQTDAAQGPGNECINASTIVFNDAATKVFNDVQTNLYNDSLNVENQANKVRKDISKLQADIDVLRNDAAVGPSNAQSAIDGANQSIASAIATANQQLDEGNAIVVKAYQIANSVGGTGSCAGFGPGKPPKPVAHIG